MAHMYPATGPTDDTESGAEVELYALLKRTLGPEYHVIHSTHWHTTDDSGRPMDGEADFIIIHPDHGVLVLEVKGGRVRLDGQSKKWTRIHRSGKKERLKRNPDKQAMRSMHVLISLLPRAVQTKPYAGAYRLGYGVWLPHVEWPRGGAGMLQGLDDIILDAHSLADPEGALIKLFHHFAGPTPPTRLSAKAVKALVSLLTPTIDPRPISSLAADIAGEEQRIQQLTTAQYERLQAMWRHYRHLAVPGAAGTGKTVIAMEMGSRLANEGLDVLVLVPHQTIADRLAYRIEQDPRPDKPHVDVKSLKELVTAVAKAGGQREREIGPLRVTSPENQKTLSSILSQNIRALEQRRESMPYDAILVDEAEDIEQALWTPIQKLLRDRVDGFFYVFYDEAQRIDLPGKFTFRPAGNKALLPLVANCRNTRTIYELMARYNETLIGNTFEGPPGRPVQYLVPATPVAADGAEPGGDPSAKAHEDALGKTLDELLGADGGLRPEDVLVITCRSETKSQWYRSDGRTIGKHTLRWVRRGERDGCVPLATIRSAKGLESKVVILAELDGLRDEEANKRRALLYVAISRAMYHLVVLGSEQELEGKQPSLWGGLVAAVAGGRRASK